MSEQTFIRSFTAKKSGEPEISAIFQPYCVGMYAVIGGQQMSLRHKGLERKTWKVIKEFEANGYTVEVHEDKYTSFLSEEDFKKYVEPELTGKKKKITIFANPVNPNNVKNTRKLE